MKQKKIAINGIEIYPFSTCGEILNFIEDQKKILIAINSLKITNATEEIRNIINKNIGYADGVGVILGMKRKGCKDAIKIPGCELWLKIIEKYQTTKSFYFIGGKDSVIVDTIKKLKSEYPSLKIINYQNGFFDETKKVEIIREIKDKKPDVVMVAMGSPKQELFMNELLSLHPALYMGLGGSFDVYSGNGKRANGWWVKHNLEWLYRLIKQPHRIKSQLSLVKYFFCLLLKIY